MKSKQRTKKIMQRIIPIEEGRLKRTLNICIPITILLVIVSAYSVKHTVERLVEHEIFTSIAQIEYDEDVVIPHDIQHVIKSVNIVWVESEKAFLAVFVISIASIAVLIAKTHLLTYPHRFRQIHKLKSETL